MSLRTVCIGVSETEDLEVLIPVSSQNMKVVGATTKVRTQYLSTISLIV